MRLTKGGKTRGSVLKRLRPDEARDVLHRLLAAHPDLRAEAETIARSYLAEVGFETIADEVEEAVCTPGLDELNGRAGRHEWGYVEPTEAAWEILEEAVEPFVADIKRRVELGLEADALAICKGVVLGLHRANDGKRGELLEWAPDFPAEAAGETIEAWRARPQTKRAARTGPQRSRPLFPREFTDRLDSKWRDMIARILPRKR